MRENGALIEKQFRQFVVKAKNREGKRKNNMKVEWNNKQGSRDRQAVAVIVTPDGGVYEFKGEPIPQVCHAQRTGYEKAGKWSNTTFLVTTAEETVFVAFKQDWDTGRTWPQASWEEAFEWLRGQAPLANKAKFETFLRESYSKTAARFDEQKKSEEAFSQLFPTTSASPPVQQ